MKNIAFFVIIFDVINITDLNKLIFLCFTFNISYILYNISITLIIVNLNNKFEAIIDFNNLIKIVIIIALLVLNIFILNKLILFVLNKITENKNKCFGSNYIFKISIKFIIIYFLYNILFKNC